MYSRTGLTDILTLFPTVPTQPGGHKRLTASLLGFSLLLAAWSHMYVQPYTPTAPKRMVINHFVFTEADPAVSTAQHDQIIAMRTVNESIAIAGADSTALEQVGCPLYFKRSVQCIP
eukprot:1148898-Pelagomonas_calceolata.AAC.3